MFVGILRGIDQPLNAVLEQTVERVFSNEEPMQEDPLGVYVIRGELVCCIGTFVLTPGEFEEKAEVEAHLQKVTAAPFPRLFV